MIQFLTKENQYVDKIFNGNFIVNKPVISGAQPQVAPYSNIYYFSHSVAIADCQFPLHPHSGFEIVTFIVEGNIEHFDTETKVWTPLVAGDFQVIQAGSGLQHSEKLLKGSRAFQIWFDPNFATALHQKPSYADYKKENFLPIMENNISTINYIGNGSNTQFFSEGVEIKKIILDNEKALLSLEENSIYLFYILHGNCIIGNSSLQKDDAIKISAEKNIEIISTGNVEIFIVKTNATLSYKTVFERQKNMQEM